MILNTERGASRFNSLLSMLHLENRMISKDEDLSENLLVPIDYGPINKILGGWKSKSVDYVRQYL